MKFKGSAKYQVKCIFELSGMLQFGQSKHMAKHAARAGGACSPTEYAQSTDIYSFSTYRAYFKTCSELLQYAADVHGVKRADRLAAGIVHAFLLTKSDVKLATFRRYAAALTKFDAAISKLTDRPPQWTKLLGEFRASAPVALESEQPARAYRNPSALVEQIDGDMRLAAELQWRSGLRVSEACNIRLEQLKGSIADNNGIIEIKGKGGKVRIVPVPAEIYERLYTKLAAGEAFTVEPGAYRRSLRSAANKTGQEYAGRGTHGLRWNFAQDRLDTLIAGGVVHEVALAVVSHEMGHERASITLHYQRRG